MKNIGELFDLRPEDKETGGPVECLGMTFENNEAHNRVSRRELRVGG